MFGAPSFSFLPWLGFLGSALDIVHAYGQAPARDLCPETCWDAGNDPSQWTVVGEIGQLKACARPLILDLNARAPLSQKQHIRACNVYGAGFRPSEKVSPVAADGLREEQVTPQLAWTPASSDSDIGGRLAPQSLDHLRRYLEHSPEPLGLTVLFGTTGETTVGVFVGAELLKTSVTQDFFASLTSVLDSVGLANDKSALLQLCEGRSQERMFGLVAAASSEFDVVHHAVGQWANGTCVDTSSYAETLQLNATTITSVMPPPPPPQAPVSSNSTSPASTNATVAEVSRLRRRQSTCQTVTVISGNDCGMLLTKCRSVTGRSGMTAQEFYGFNPKANFCSTLQAGQKVCCSTGGLPGTVDPEGNADGTCKTVTVAPGNLCGDLLNKCGRGIVLQQLEKFNPISRFCNTLQEGQRVCCTKGKLPVPVDPEGNADGTCKTVTVAPGNLCPALVTKCGRGINQQQLEKFNPINRFCNTLQEGQRVCCTKGKLEDIRPKMNADGTCVKYQIKLGEYCSTVAVRHGLTVDELKELNKNTWGWNGCDYGFWTGNWLCLSPGIPPFPAPISNAVCGPQKPGSVMPAGSTSRSWAAMNPCPLKACCNTWGQCGTTADFCVDTNTGPPGTAKKDTYGCISNCGMDPIIGPPPTRFIKLGYFEGWNLGRGCLNMDVGQIDPSYTHVHFAFGMIRRHTYEIYHESVHAEYQFNQFKHLRFQKRIISFGGWVFSAEAPNYPVFREGVRDAATREKFANNLVKFVLDHDLDGLDLDWEYPAAPDLPDIPPGDLSEATNYLELIKLLRRKLPSSKSLSIAAPASYWYLKQFPIEEMARQLDYIVYMTYDLHGQWDAGNKWASPGCPTGNCLRSHVNMTETLNALTMITRAGVPSNKVLVGVTSYGRSFQMADPSCTGPNCFFTGTRLHSNARKGRCTDTAGYISNAEIDEMAARGGRSFRDVTESDIYIDGDLWVSYMKDDNKIRRASRYVGMNMGGTIDWAVDLQRFYQPPTSGWDFRGNLISNVRVSWPQLKAQIDAGDRIGCDKRIKTGTWAGKACDTEETTRNLARYTPRERWKALDCQSAWRDTMHMWLQCEFGHNTSTFSNTVNMWLGGAGNTNCDDTSSVTACTNIERCWDRQPPMFTGHDRIGACAFDIWNSFVRLHTVIKNFHDSLTNVANTLTQDGKAFIETFTANQDDNDKFLDFLFGFLTIPLGVSMEKLFGGSLMELPFFSGDFGSVAKEGLQTAVTSLVDVSMGIAQDEVKLAGKPEELSYKELIDLTVKSWKKQVDRLMVTMFNGQHNTLNALGEIFKDGKLLDGARGAGSSKLKARDDDQTDNWGREKAIERAYYAIAIPAVWASRELTPVVVDFGKGCNIDARDYFNHGPAVYNQGFTCQDGRSYILAGAFDGPARVCGDTWPGNPVPCPDPGPQKPLSVLAGIGELQRRDNPWGQIVLDDLVRGAVATFNASEFKNKLDDERGGFPGVDDLKGGEMGRILDVTAPGHIRIPVCDREEVMKNYRKGRASYGSSANWPCNPPPPA